MSESINVMIVNDSILLRSILSDMIQGIPGINVTVSARNGIDALKKLELFPIDVILLDLEMPKMDGLEFIECIMNKKPLPIIIISSYSHSRADIILKCLNFGAVDVMNIPTDNPKILMVDQYKEKLQEKIIAAHNAKLYPIIKPKKIQTQKSKSSSHDKAACVVVIGASMGGPRVLTELLPQISADIQACILIIQHMPAPFTESFAKRLNKISKIDIKEAENGDILENGKGFVAPGNYHMEITDDGKISLNQKEKRIGSRPSVNVSMLSALDYFDKKVVGVLLTGLGYDGAFGMKMIKKHGGINIAQNRESSLAYGMPKAAIEMGVVDKELPKEKIPSAIVTAVNEII